MDTLLAVLEAEDDAKQNTVDAIAEFFPKTVGLASDVTSGARGALKIAAAVGTFIKDHLQSITSIAELPIKEALQGISIKLSVDLADKQLSADTEQAFREMIDVLDSQSDLSGTAIKMQAVSAAAMRYSQLVARGDALQVEREKLRMNWATDLSAKRYRNMSYRIFRDDQLARYQQVFDNAARYAFLAAKAYDYETGLLASDA